MIGWSVGWLLTLLALNCRSAVALHDINVAEPVGGDIPRQRPRTTRSLSAVSCPSHGRWGSSRRCSRCRRTHLNTSFNWFLGPAAGGTFAVLAYPFLLGNVAVTAMGQAAAPQFATRCAVTMPVRFDGFFCLPAAAARSSVAELSVLHGWAGARSRRRLFAPCRAALWCPVRDLPLHQPSVTPTSYRRCRDRERRLGIQLWVRVATIVAVLAGRLSESLEGIGRRGIRTSFRGSCGRAGMDGYCFFSVRAAPLMMVRPWPWRGPSVCGIFGFITPSRPVDMAKCAAALGSLQHRGPDGFGIATGRLADRRLEFSANTKLGANPRGPYLGHMRLAIVDLSESALQPMTNETKDVWVVFNGEIYNHAELRVQLQAHGHQFRTHHSDTEVGRTVLKSGGDRPGGSPTRDVCLRSY